MSIIELENKKIMIEEEKIKEKFQNLSLKFYVFNQQKIINAKKSDTLISLKRNVIQEFGLIDLKEENIRIRAFNILNSQMLESMKDDLKVILLVNN